MLDVVTCGTCYTDLLFTGLPGLPRLGTEIFAGEMGLAPGGIANVAIALARLGLRTGLVTVLGDDIFGDFVWRSLEAEGVDLSATIRVPGLRTPVTVSLSYPEDRAMVTYEERHDQDPLPAPCADYWDGVRGFFQFIGPGLDSRLLALRERGIRLFADSAWDPSGAWRSECLAILPYLDAFLPNQAEALAYTRAPSLEAALERLAQQTATVVVKCGPAGVLARQGERLVQVPALPVTALDTTGAGDVFNAGYIYAALAGWPLEARVRSGNLCAGISVTRHGGSLGAPTWAEIQAFVDRLPVADRRPWQEISGYGGI
jgi:sugar/nucleoside kinase (ribokinase family)